MPLLVPDVVRFTVNQTEAGRNIANVLDYRITDPTFPVGRAAACAAQAKAIAAAWTLHVRLHQVNNLTFNSVSWVDLDAEDGSTGSFTGDVDVVLPVAGSGSVEALIQSVAVLIHKNLVGAARGHRRGRLYMAGASEDTPVADDPRQVSAAFQAVMTTEFADFLDATNLTPGPFSSEMVVVHITSRDESGNPLTGDSTAVSSLTVDPIFATQRRRLR